MFSLFICCLMNLAVLRNFTPWTVSISHAAFLSNVRWHFLRPDSSVRPWCLCPLPFPLWSVTGLLLLSLVFVTLILHSLCDHHLLGVQIFLECRFMSLWRSRCPPIAPFEIRTLLPFCLLSHGASPGAASGPETAGTWHGPFRRLTFGQYLLNQWRMLLNCFMGSYTNRESFLAFFTPQGRCSLHMLYWAFCTWQIRKYPQLARVTLGMLHTRQLTFREINLPRWG